MSQLGTCADGCSERRLELVRAAAHDELVELRENAISNLEALRPVIEALRKPLPESERRCAEEYRWLASAARDALRRAPVIESGGVGDAPAEAAVTWWCAGCNGLDAPQPCLGICVWRPVEWVERDVYEHERISATLMLEKEQRIRWLAKRLALVTPRAGRCREAMEAFQREQVLSSRET